MKLYAKIQKIFDMTKLRLAKVGALLRIIQKETVSVLNCTPKVRQKTFGVQFVYEKDICRKT